MARPVNRESIQQALKLRGLLRKPSIRVLLIDDDPAIHLIGSVALEEAGGFEVACAPDGDEGLATARAEQPDLILLDQQMPDADGDEVFRRLLAEPELAEIPVIFLTATRDESVLHRFEDLGAAGVIAKPFAPEELAARVRAMLENAGGGEPAQEEHAKDPLKGLRRSFLEDGLRDGQRLLQTWSAAAKKLARKRAAAIERKKDAVRKKAALKKKPPPSTDFVGMRIAVMRRRRLLAKKETAPRWVQANSLVSQMLNNGGKPARPQADGAVRDDDSLDEKQLQELNDIVHQWVGRGGTLGYPAISDQARSLETLLDRSRVLDPESLVAHLGVITASFAEAIDAADAPAAAGSTRSTIGIGTQKPTGSQPTVPKELVEWLRGYRIGIAGFDAEHGRRVYDVLAGAGATPAIVESSADAASPPDAYFDLVIAGPEGDRTGADAGQHSKTALLIVCSQESLLELDADARAHEFLFTPWTPEELILRAHQVVSRAAAAKGALLAADRARPASAVIADDDPTITSLVATTFGSYGIVCEVAHEGNEALELVRRKPPGVVVLDINMPQLDGFEVLAAIRNDPEGADIPVILLTSRNQESDIIRAFGLGANDYVTKPFSPMELVARVKRLIQSAK